MKVTACECTQAGWCPRHRCHKTEFLFQLCRRMPAYFQMWEQGRGPGQGEPSPAGPVRFEPCAHRGRLLRTESCAGCRGAVLIKVFACTVHGACTLVKALVGVAPCSGCPDFVAAQVAPATDCRSTPMDS